MAVGSQAITSALLQSCLCWLLRLLRVGVARCCQRVGLGCATPSSRATTTTASNQQRSLHAQQSALHCVSCQHRACGRLQSLPTAGATRRNSPPCHVAVYRTACRSGTVAGSGTSTAAGTGTKAAAAAGAASTGSTETGTGRGTGGARAGTRAGAGAEAETATDIGEEVWLCATVAAVATAGVAGAELLSMRCPAKRPQQQLC